MRTAVPGPAGSAAVEALARTECPALTARRARRAERAGAPHDPIVWARARGANVEDTDGNVFVDLTAGFGAAAVGHAHPKVVAAIASQAGALVHALGDVHPSAPKVALLERLCALAPWERARCILGLGGADAVGAALKTAALATGRGGVLAFEGGYHGLAHGPLAACGYSEAFRAPFASQLNPDVVFAPWPDPETDPRAAVAAVERRWSPSVGAVLVEPIQGRGGVRVPPRGFLAALADLAATRGALLVVDEIQTGLGRCGAPFAHVEEGARADLVCVGKALGGGMPVSACLGREEVMRAWGDPAGEAIHTGTFFGHPVGCAAALAALDVIEEEGLAARAARLGASFAARLEGLRARRPAIREVRGRGLLLGVELDRGDRALRVVRGLLERGYLTLPAGRGARVLGLTPPLTIAEELLEGFVEALDRALAAEER